MWNVLLEGRSDDFLKEVELWYPGCRVEYPQGGGVRAVWLELPGRRLAGLARRIKTGRCPRSLFTATVPRPSKGGTAEGLIGPAYHERERILKEHRSKPVRWALPSELTAAP